MTSFGIQVIDHLKIKKLHSIRFYTRLGLFIPLMQWKLSTPRCQRFLHRKLHFGEHEIFCFISG